MGWVGVRIMWPAEAKVMVSSLCPCVVACENVSLKTSLRDSPVADDGR